MQDYILNWSSSTKQTITLTPKSTLDPGTTSGTSQCSLILFGKGAPRYGEGQQENFIRILENFASTLPPTAPTTGQLWFDTAANFIKIYDSDSSWRPVNSVYLDSSPPAAGRSYDGMLWFNTANSEMSIYGSGAWKSFSTPIPVAGVEEYNMMVANYNLIAGTPTDVSDRAASFNGGTSLITVTPTSPNDFNMTDYTSGTIELWVSPKSLALMTLIKQTYPAGSPDDTAWRLSITERGTVAFELAGAPGMISETSEFDTVELDEWNHIAITFNSTNVAIFLNGKLVSDKPGRISPNSGAGLFIGRNMTPINAANDIWSFYGLMDNIRITKNVVRYTANFDPSTITNESFLSANDPHFANVKFLMRMDTLAEDTGKTITTTDVMITPQAFGYGQTELETTASINNTSWLNLLGKFRNIALHQGNTEAFENLSARGFIIEPNAIPPINCGLMTLMREYDKTEHAVNSLIKNSTMLAPAASTSDPKASFSGAISWNALAPGENIRYLEVFLTFPTVEATRAFFNAGGKIKISKSFTPSSMTGANLALSDALGLTGDTYITAMLNTDTLHETGSFKVLQQMGDEWYVLYNTYDFVDYGGAFELATKSRKMPVRNGYYGITSSFSNILEVMTRQDDNPSSPRIRYYVTARTENGDRDVRIRIQYSLEQGATVVSGTLDTAVTSIKPNSAYLASPVISHPSATSSNTFI